MSVEHTVTVVLENEARIQIKAVDSKGRVSCYFALNSAMVVISPEELDLLAEAIDHILKQLD
jgi:hypothetical protein